MSHAAKEYLSWICLNWGYFECMVWLLTRSMSKYAHSHNRTSAECDEHLCTVHVIAYKWWCKTILGQPHNTRITHDEGTTTRNSQVHSINKIKGPTLVSACQVSSKLSNVLLCLQISFRFLTSQSIKQTHWTTISDAPFPVCQYPIRPSQRHNGPRNWVRTLE